MREQKTFCRLCIGSCGMIATVDGDGRLAAVRGDPDDPVTQGYACLTGLQSPAVHNDETRLHTPLKHLPDGRFVPIPADQAYDEIAEKLAMLSRGSGPDSVAVFKGTAGYSNQAAAAMLPAWLRAMGSSSFFTTMTIDQSAKWVAEDRLGSWAAGRHNFADADVILLFGGNPVVSATVLGFANTNPVKSIKAARARGMKLVVIDPRNTETARLADILLQPLPGEDVAIAAGLLHIILSNGWHDADFCARYVTGMDRLRAAVAPFTPEVAAARAGVTAQALEAVATAFTGPCGTKRRGPALSGTGPDMGPHSNLAEHLIECLNVVCGRYRRAGDPIVNPVLLSTRRPLHAEVVAPVRAWESGRLSRVRGLGMLRGQMLSGALADEILLPGEGQVRSLFVVGGNPMGALPDPRKTERALRSLDLLVTIDPFMTPTARLSHYVLPPQLQYERADISAPNDLIVAPYYAVTRPVAAAPADVIEEWRPFWEVARRLRKQIVFADTPLNMHEPPTTDALLALLTRHAQLPSDEIRATEGGRVRPDIRQYVEPARPGATGRFAVMPADVAADLAGSLSERTDAAFPYRLAVRRTRGVLNTAYHGTPGIRRRQQHNPAYMNGGDMAKLGLVRDDRVTLETPYGRIRAIVAEDADLRAGVVSMSHGWGPVLADAGDAAAPGASTSFLLSTEQRVEPINAMIQMTGVPLAVHAGWPDEGDTHGLSIIE